MLPNTTQTPNCIFDYWMSRLKGGEFKILLCIVRNTLGWIEDPATGRRKELDNISQRELEAMAGVQRDTITKAMSTLIDELGIVQAFDEEWNSLDSPNKRREVGQLHRPLFYRISLHNLDAKAYPENQTPIQPLVSENTTPLVSENTTQVLKKELLLKKSTEESFSEATADAVTSSKRSDDYPNPEKHYDKPYGPRSLKGWSRADILGHHHIHPTTPPDGCSYVQAISCAIATMPGFDNLLANFKEGYTSFYRLLQRVYSKGMKEYKFEYPAWMDAALSFDSYPSPTGTPASLAYFLTVIRIRASEATSTRYEQAHQQAMNNWDKPGDITFEDILRTAKEMGVELNV